jgi:hypothetical protein
MVPEFRWVWCTVCVMTRISVDVNDEWLDAAREVLGTETKVATINAALHAFAVRKQAKEIIAALDSVKMDFAGSGEAWGYGGGRDLSRLVEDARDERTA